MASDDFAVVLVRGLSWRTDDESKSRRVCHTALELQKMGREVKGMRFLDVAGERYDRVSTDRKRCGIRTRRFSGLRHSASDKFLAVGKGPQRIGGSQPK